MSQFRWSNLEPFDRYDAPCLWVLSLGPKSRCLGEPWPRPSFPGATGPNHHLAWLYRMFWVLQSPSVTTRWVLTSPKKCGTIIAQKCRSPTGLCSVRWLQCIFIELNLLWLCEVFCVTRQTNFFSTTSDSILQILYLQWLSVSETLSCCSRFVHLVRLQQHPRHRFWVFISRLSLSLRRGFYCSRRVLSPFAAIVLIITICVPDPQLLWCLIQ